MLNVLSSALSSDLPLHPAIVHLPIGLSVVLPPVLIALAVLWYRERADRAAWAIGAVLSVMLAVSSYVATETGEEDEERVEEVVPEDAIHEHEEAAEAFLVLSGVVAALSAAALIIPGRKFALIAAGLSSAVSLTLPLQALVVGHAGGELVYVHNAASVHAGAPGAGGEAGAGSEAGEAGEASEAGAVGEARGGRRGPGPPGGR